MKRFYSYSSENGITLHDSLEAAKNAADEELCGYRDMASDEGWEESEVQSICYGVVIGQSVKTFQRNKEDMTEEEIEDCPCDMEKFDAFVDYDVKEF